MKTVSRNVGSAAAPGVVLRVDASPGEVSVIRTSATTALSPRMARELGKLLSLAADVAEGGRK
jgi:hypothetical protein